MKRLGASDRIIGVFEAVRQDALYRLVSHTKVGGVRGTHAIISTPHGIASPTLCLDWH